MRSLQKKQGFTLIEMAIVLVVIGLILGMVFKGRQLIDQAKIKNIAAQYNKIVAGINTFYDRYGFYPGDGCTDGAPDSPMECTDTKSGYVEGLSENNDVEATAFWHLLINVTGILSDSDRETVYGQPWEILEGNNESRGLDPQTNWLDIPGGGVSQEDVRIACALDRMIDDGDADTGIVITFGSLYSPNDDCWGLSGRANSHIKVIP